MLQDSDEEKSAKIEKQLLELWDRVYQAWLSNNDVGPQVNAAAIEQSWRTFVDDITKTPGSDDCPLALYYGAHRNNGVSDIYNILYYISGIFNTSGLVDFAKQNVGTLMALLDSLWSLFKGNITLVLGSLTSVTSVLLGGSTAVLNFILGMVSFHTVIDLTPLCIYMYTSELTVENIQMLITKMAFSIKIQKIHNIHYFIEL